MSAVKNVINDNYNNMLLDEYLKEKIKDAGYSGVNISKVPTGTKIVLFVTKPGIVIGRKGSGIQELTKKFEEGFGFKNPQISVEEIKKPELSPNVMCNRMAAYIQRGTAFRRATMWTMQQIMEKGALGVQITISGKLRGDRSAFEKHSAGILPRAGDYADKIVSEDIAHVETAMGLIGIRIRIAIKEKIIPEFEYKNKKETQEKVDKDKEIENGIMEKTESDQIKVDEDKEIENVTVAKTESDQIKIDEEKISKLETMEEEEQEMK